MKDDLTNYFFQMIMILSRINDVANLGVDNHLISMGLYRCYS